MSDQSNEVLLSIVESPLYFFHIEVEVLPMDAPVMIEPVFRIGPEMLDPVEVVEQPPAFAVALVDHLFGGLAAQPLLLIHEVLDAEGLGGMRMRT